MRTCYLKEMRIARYNIRHGLPGAQKSWAKEVCKKRNKELSRFKNKGNSTNITMASFLPIDFDDDFLDIPILYCKEYCTPPDYYKMIEDYINPIVNYTGESFHFSEAQLRNAIYAMKGNADDLVMAVCEHQPGVQLSAVNWDIRLREQNSRLLLYDLNEKLKKCYEFFSCTECKITYLGVNMVIYRFQMNNSQEGLFFLYPSLELSGCPVEMDESSFCQLDFMALLQDMVDEVCERQEILVSFQKKMIVKKMSYIANDQLHLEILDKETVAKLAIDCYEQGMDYYSALKLLKKEFMSPLKDYFDSCVLSHPESVKNCFNISVYETYKGIWKISLRYHRKKTRNAFELVTENSEEDFSFVLDNGQLSQYALNQYLEHVEVYALKWFYLTKHFKEVFSSSTCH